jgi:TldD protein
MNRTEVASAVLLEDNALDIQDLHRTLGLVMEHRVDFADLYFQDMRSESWSMENGQVTSASYTSDQGFGLRACVADETAFAYSQQIDSQHLREAACAVRSVSECGAARINLASPMPRAINQELYPGTALLSARAGDAKISLLQSLDRRIRARDPRIVRVLGELQLSHSVVMVMRHDGRLAADLRPLICLRMQVFAKQGNRTERSIGYIGGRAGFELIEGGRVDEEIGRVVNSVLIKLEAQPTPAGNMPVVIGPGWPGMLLHEAMGHGFEGDFNRLGTSVYAGKLGQQVANPVVNIVDDGTLQGRRGSLHFDDEGEHCQRTQLIEGGVLTGYMYDSMNARLLGQASTGNGRRESYASLPLPRMTNTFMQGGQHCADEIIASVQKGLYLVELGSGQVDIVSGQYSFECELAYLIENGRVTRPVRGGTLIGNGPQTLHRISMVGNDLALDNGGAMCGKAGQNVPVCVGQPTLKVDELVVAGVR